MFAYPVQGHDDYASMTADSLLIRAGHPRVEFVEVGTRVGIQRRALCTAQSAHSRLCIVVVLPSLRLCNPSRAMQCPAFAALKRAELMRRSSWLSAFTAFSAHGGRHIIYYMWPTETENV